ncbi:zinc-dependent alcohol dehydrogenase [Salmonella enterica subsp. arizonae]|nr:zinc-dependent alcohol dehydrogenase [Salmonella enterica subsp. arizonae]
MKAMVYYGEHDIRFEERQKPQLLNSGDVIIRMTKTTICGTDLGILKGKTLRLRRPH